MVRWQWDTQYARFIPLTQPQRGPAALRRKLTFHWRDWVERDSSVRTGGEGQLATGGVFIRRGACYGMPPILSSSSSSPSSSSYIQQDTLHLVIHLLLWETTL